MKLGGNNIFISLNFWNYGVVELFQSISCFFDGLHLMASMSSMNSTLSAYIPRTTKTIKGFLLIWMISTCWVGLFDLPKSQVLILWIIMNYLLKIMKFGSVWIWRICWTFFSRFRCFLLVFNWIVLEKCIFWCYANFTTPFFSFVV